MPLGQVAERSNGKPTERWNRPSAQTVPVLMRRATFTLAAIALLLLSLASPALGAGEVVITVSPSEARLGQQVEVHLRTFIPITGTMDLPPPRPYPAPSGSLNVLYPWDDYPFDVRAEIDDQTVRITLVRDVNDSTLWRAFWTPTRAGTWTVQCHNFPKGTPGASTTVRVIDTPDASTNSPVTDAPPRASMDDWVTAAVALLGLAGGVPIGLLVARVVPRRSV
jgi:hypothetical protein